MSGDDFDLKICCMGAGYVGGPTMAVIAKMCPRVSHPAMGHKIHRCLDFIVLYDYLMSLNGVMEKRKKEIGRISRITSHFPSLTFSMLIVLLSCLLYRSVSVLLILTRNKLTPGTAITFLSTNPVSLKSSKNA
jgi:hypothetical protein